MLGNNMFAYCNNNPVNCVDPSGLLIIADDLLIYGFVTLVVVVLVPLLMPPPSVLQKSTIFKAFTQAAEDIANLLLAKKKPESLPKEGDPNSDKEILNDDGTVKQRRHYDENGSADYDIDFNHPDDGTHEFPHVHKWTNGKRPKEWIPFSEFFSLN